jgi:hypothetical protein
MAGMGIDQPCGLSIIILRQLRIVPQEDELFKHDFAARALHM